MSIITEVRFAHEDGALADTLNAHPDLAVSVIREASTNPEHNIDLFRFGERDDIETILEEDHTVSEIKPMLRFEDQRLLGIEFEPGAKLLNPEVTNKDGFVLQAQDSNTSGSLRGWHERWLLPDRNALQDIWQYARDEGFTFEVIEFRQQGQATPIPGQPGLNALTEQQREALVAAYEQGYFTEPRETSLEELAVSLDLSATAVGGRLRRGMKSLIGITLAVDDYET
jgi:hypothetical protein